MPIILHHCRSAKATAGYLRSTAGRLTVIDDVHRMPQLFATLRSLIDERRRAGHRAGEFLLLCSASLELVQHSAETLAGRDNYIEFQPIGPEGAAGSDIGLDSLWLRGGFPDSLLARDDASADAPCSHLSCLVLFGIESRIQE